MTHTILKLALDAPPQPIRTIHTVDLDDHIASYVETNRGALEAAALQRLGTRQFPGNDIALRHFSLAIGTPSADHPSASGYTMVLAHNHFAFTSTVPGPTPSGMDPRFEVDFDLMVVADIESPKASDPAFRVADATATVTHATISGGNITGAIGVALAAITNWVAQNALGRDVIAQAIGDKLTRDVTNMIANRLLPINNVLREQLAASGAKIKGSSFDSATGTTTITIFVPEPLTHEQIIRVELSDQTPLAQPMPISHASAHGVRE